MTQPNKIENIRFFFQTISSIRYTTIHNKLWPRGFSVTPSPTLFLLSHPNKTLFFCLHTFSASTFFSPHSLLKSRANYS